MAINLNDLQQMLDAAATSQQNEKEVRKSLVRVENLISNVQQEITHIYSLLLLDDAEVAKKPRKARAEREAVEIDSEAPYGRKNDGTPKSKPGRAKDGDAA
jgi:hypothetical protein